LLLADVLSIHGGFYTRFAGILRKLRDMQLNKFAA
jgi:hypothetical protein